MGESEALYSVNATLDDPEPLPMIGEPASLPPGPRPPVRPPPSRLRTALWIIGAVAAIALFLALFAYIYFAVIRPAPERGPPGHDGHDGSTGPRGYQGPTGISAITSVWQSQTNGSVSFVPVGVGCQTAFVVPVSDGPATTDTGDFTPVNIGLQTMGLTAFKSGSYYFDVSSHLVLGGALPASPAPILYLRRTRGISITTVCGSQRSLHQTAVGNPYLTVSVTGLAELQAGDRVDFVFSTPAPATLSFNSNQSNAPAVSINVMRVGDYNYDNQNCPDVAFC